MSSATLLAQTARHILLRALSAEYGVRVRIHTSSDMIQPANRARQVLYRFKNEDPDFADLQIRADPDDPNDYLWIIQGRLVAKAEDELDDPEPRSRGADPIDIEL